MRLPFISRRREPERAALVPLADLPAPPAVRVVAVESMRPILTAARLVRLFTIPAAFTEGQITKFSRTFRTLTEDELIGLEADALAVATDDREAAIVRRLGLTVAEIARSARGGRRPNRAAIARLGEISRALVNV